MELTFLVKIKKQTAKSSDRFFVSVRNCRDEFTSPAVFHGVGYWATEHPKNTLDTKAQILEIWIPWEKIDYVESLMYRQRS